MPQGKMVVVHEKNLFFWNKNVWLYWRIASALWLMQLRKLVAVGRGGDQVVSLLAFYSDNPRSNPAEPYSFLQKLCLKRT